MKKKTQMALAALVCLAFMLPAEAAGAVLPQKAVIGGTLLRVAAVGSAVREGETLAEVDTLAGPVPAAKAAEDGVVQEVKVRSGAAVKRGDVILLLETAG